METDDPDGKVECVFSPAPPAANADWWEAVSLTALGHTTVVSRGYDKDTDDTWIVLDSDDIDKAVQLNLEAEMKGEAKRKTQALFGGAAPWYSSRRKKPKGTASGDPSRGHVRQGNSDKTGKTTLASPKKNIKKTKKKREKNKEKKKKYNRLTDSD